eukprot:TRINITY_DN31299_c0_g1_i1.p1 TRINITY_DN31299_c0_g1~~TRINITY_DN31299_c0_g1_i1.p1  ORF type:complete len:241 (+),score=75.17 TRINITY_DN31299_c0_g1_i1:46-723(+)
MLRAGVTAAAGAALLVGLWRVMRRRAVELTDGAFTAAERAVLEEELFAGLTMRGARELRWWGRAWTDRTEGAETCLAATAPIPPRSQAILDRIAARCGLPCGVNVATAHIYHRARAKNGTGLFKTQKVAITPHADDRRLAGPYHFVLMLQLTESCDMHILNLAGPQDLLRTLHRAPYSASVVRDAAYYQRRHALMWPADARPDALMKTLTLRYLPFDGDDLAAPP